MGNENSAQHSKAQDGYAAKVVTSTEPKHVPKQRMPTRKAEKVGVGVYPTEQHGNKPLDNDDTFANYIQRAKNKMRSLSNIGGRTRRHHEEQSNNPAATSDHVSNVVNSNKKENERDQFSDFIQNARKKLRTVTTIRKNDSFRKGKDGSGH